MKKLKPFIILSAFVTASAYGACNKSVNPKKVVLFVDTNTSPAEIKDAAFAACERGETFKVIPEEGKRVDAGVLQTELSKMAAGKIAVTSMVVSGHNGGGSVHGTGGTYRGSLDKTQIVDALKTAYKTQPNLLAEFKSVFMWGCWSMGPSEVDYWRRELPSIKMASGFIDKGPLNTTEAAHTVLRDLLIKEKKMTQEADQKKLKRIIASVEHINQTYAAVYTDALCGDMYYYNTKGSAHGVYESRNQDDENFKAGTHYVDFNKSFDCNSAQPNIEKYRKELIPYFYGKKPLPPNDDKSPVLKIYSYIRSHAHCLKKNHVMNGDRIGMLRFFEEIKQNFATTFADEITEANKGIVGIQKISGKDEDLKAYYSANRHKYFNPRGDVLKTKSRKDIMEMISYLDGLVKVPELKKSKYAKDVNSLKKLRNAMETYLFQLNPNCMNFLSWHEYQPGVKKSYNCSI